MDGSRAAHRAGSSRPQLHLVTDPRYPRAMLLRAVAAAAERGADWVQVRAPVASARDLHDLAREIVALCRPLGARVAVNDRVDVALAASADGVQLGARSLPVTAARSIIGGRPIGASAHGLDEAARAAADGADWVTFGHIFATASHPDEPPRGVAALAEVARAVSVPVIAIGGIDEARVGEVMAAGAAGVAVISAILGASDPALATTRLRQALDAAARQT